VSILQRIHVSHLLLIKVGNVIYELNALVAFIVIYTHL